MPRIQTVGVRKPSANTLLYGVLDYDIQTGGEACVINTSAFAYSDYSIQNGVVCAIGYGSTSNNTLEQSRGYGVTNTSNPIAQNSAPSIIVYRTYVDQTIEINVRIWGESVSGYGAYNNGSSSGAWGSPLAIARASITIPAKPAAGHPEIVVDKTQDNVARVTVRATSGGAAYRYIAKDVSTGAETAVNVVADSWNFFTMPDGSAYEFFGEAQNGNGVWSRGQTSGRFYSRPIPPTNLTASINGASVNLRWSGVQIHGSNGLMVSRRAVNTTAWTVVGYPSVGATTFTDTPLGGAWEYKVTLNVQLPPGSFPLIFIDSNTTTAVSMVPPLPVSNLVVDSTLPGDFVHISWTNNPVSGTSPYSDISIECRDNGTKVLTVDLTAEHTEFDLKMPRGTVWDIAVVASNAAGSTPASVADRAIGRPHDALVSVIKVEKNVVTYEIDTTAVKFNVTPTSFSCMADISYNDGASWGYIGYFPAGQKRTGTATVPAAANVIIRIRVSAGFGSIYKDSDYQQDNTVVAFDPLPVDNIEFNNLTYATAITYPADIAPRNLKVVAHGETIFDGQIGAFADIQIITVVPDTTVYTITASITTPYQEDGAPPVSKSINVDMCSNAIMIGQQRHLATLVEDDGTATPLICKVI
jgi:hypothetical protein